MGNTQTYQSHFWTFDIDATCYTVSIDHYRDGLREIYINGGLFFRNRPTEDTSTYYDLMISTIESASLSIDVEPSAPSGFSYTLVVNGKGIPEETYRTKQPGIGNCFL